MYHSTSGKVGYEYHYQWLPPERRIPDYLMKRILIFEDKLRASEEVHTLTSVYRHNLYIIRLIYIYISLLNKQLSLYLFQLPCKRWLTRHAWMQIQALYSQSDDLGWIRDVTLQVQKRALAEYGFGSATDLIALNNARFEYLVGLSNWTIVLYED